MVLVFIKKETTLTFNRKSDVFGINAYLLTPQHPILYVHVIFLLLLAVLLKLCLEGSQCYQL